jgi:hypothetical protein
MIESVNHIFFDCIIAWMIWGFLREVFKWQNYPKSVKKTYMKPGYRARGPYPSD